MQESVGMLGSEGVKKTTKLGYCMDIWVQTDRHLEHK